MKTTTGVITATGSGNGVTHTLNASGPDTVALVTVGGTFTTCPVVVEGKVFGGTLWVPLLMFNRATGARGLGTSTPTDSTSTGYAVDCSGMQSLRVYPSSGTPTSMTIEVASGVQSEFGSLPQLTQFSTSLTSFGAGVTLTGATGANVLSIPDNLADAFSISEGANAYLTFVTTDSGELINVKKTLKFGGTTANNIISMVDNLADALNIKEGSNSYIKITTTDGAEAITFGKMPRIPTATVAAAGSAQGSAAAIAEGFTLVSAADDTKGVVLPSAVAGMVCIVKSSVANKILKVYPNTSDAINALSADAAISLASGPTVAMFVAYDATTWYTLPLLPS